MAETNIEELRAQLRALTVEIRDAEKAYGEAIENAADAEAAYRAQLATTFGRHRADGTGVTEADTLARGAAEVVLLSRERDVAAGKVRHAAEVLEDRRDDRRNLWRLVDVIRPRATGSDERVPAERWP